MTGRTEVGLENVENQLFDQLMNYIPINWQDVQAGCAALAAKLPKPCLIWGPPRAGLIVAAMISYIEPQCRCVASSLPPPGTIIVDEIVDTGRTRQRYAQYQFASIWIRQQYISHGDYYVWVVEHDKYLLMPWEPSPCA